MRNRRLVHLRQSLESSLWASTPVVIKPHKEVVVHGPKVRAANSRPKTKEPDEVLLEIRRLSDYFKGTSKEIRRHLMQYGIEVTSSRIDQIRHYATRAHLVPSNTTRSYLEPRE